MWKRYNVLFFNNKTWVITLQYMLVSCVLLALVILVDTRTITLERYIPQIFLTKVPLATTILSALAGALLSMTVFTFSTIMTIVSFYSSNYTASTIDDFVKSDIVLKVLGIFIGGFFYAVTALLFMRDSYEHDFVIAGSVGVVYALVCVGFFVRFVQQILYGVQSTNLIKDIYEEAHQLICEEVTARDHFQKTIPHENCQTVTVYADKTGYISAIHYDELSVALEHMDAIIEIHAKIGSFTVEGANIATIYLDCLPEEELEVDNFFVIQDAKIPTTDYQYRKSQLIDITLKGLPPGKPDLNNAIHCLRKISILLAELFKVDGRYVSLGKDEANIFYEVLSTEDELYFTYYQIIPLGEKDISIVLALLDGFYTMYRTATDDNQKIIQQFANIFYERVIPSFDDPYDQKHLQHAYEKLR